MTYTPSELKNIVVIGASGAGHSLVNELAGRIPATHRILLIERTDYIVHMPTIVRAVVVPGWENKNLIAPLTQTTIFPEGSRHRVIAPNTVLSLDADSLALEHPFEGSTILPYDKVVIATGASQPPPMRAPPGSSMDEYKALLQHMQSDIARATSILVVGGGTVGVEVAGEISAAHPDKRLTLVHGEAGLLHPGERRKGEAPDPHLYVPEPTSPRLSTNLEAQLRRRGVRLVFLDRVLSGPGGAELEAGPLPAVATFPLSSGDSVDADYVFLSTGNVPNSGLIAAADPAALTPSGHVAVDARFHVLSDALPNAYALGDVASVPALKTLVSATAEGPALAKILAAELHGKTGGTYHPSGTGNSSVVTLGPGAGAGVLVLPWVGEVGAPGMVVRMKDRDFFAGKSFYSRFRGSQKVPTAM